MSSDFHNIPIHIRTELDQRIADVFQIYDFIGNFIVSNDNIPHILRFLGCVPSEKDIKEIEKRGQLEDIVGFVHMAKFMPVVVEFVQNNRMRPATIKQLEEAFKVLDPNRKMFMTEVEMQEALFDSELEPLTDEEKDEMRRTTIERPSGVCWYEKFIYKIWHEPENSVYALAEKLAAAKS